MRRGIFPTHTHLVFTALQHRENHPPSAVRKTSWCPRQPTWARSQCPPRQVRAAWSSTHADSTKDPSGAAEKGNGIGALAGSCWRQHWKLLTACFHGSPSRRDEGVQRPPTGASTPKRRLITWLCTSTRLWDTHAGYQILVYPKINASDFSTSWKSNYQSKFCSRFFNVALNLSII